MAGKAVVLLSGGIDSTTTLAIARAEGYEVYALSFRYGQRHEIELERARAIAEAFGVARHLIVTVDLREIGGSALTDESLAVPKDRAPEEIGAGIPITYVPARNTIFLAFALAWAEVLGAEDIFFGANVLDYSGYPDCRPEYLRAFEHMANLATRAGVSGQAHLILNRVHYDHSPCTLRSGMGGYSTSRFRLNAEGDPHKTRPIRQTRNSRSRER